MKTNGEPCRFDELPVGAYFYNAVGAEPRPCRKMEPVSNELNAVLNTLHVQDGTLSCSPDGMRVQPLDALEVMQACEWLFAPPPKTTPHYERVKEFMRQARQETPDKPCIPDVEILNLRARLLLEETLETIRALGINLYSEHDHAHSLTDASDFDLIAARKPDLEAIVDGFADVSVVNVGMLIACGVTDVDVLREVDENNLAKFKHVCPECGKDYDDVPLLEQMIAVNPLIGGPHPPGTIMCSCGTTFVTGYRRKDGKWVKPASHKPPAIGAVLEAQGWDGEESENSQ